MEAVNILRELFVARTADLAALKRNRPPTENDLRTERRTLYLLHKEGVVHRIPYLDLRQVVGGATYAYGLSDRGTKQFGGKTFDDHSARTLDHELEITDFHMGMRKLCTTFGRELFWRRANLKKGIHPDAYFAITDPKKDGKSDTNHFFLEIERQRMHATKDGKPSVIRKLARYYEAYNSEDLVKQWGFRTFRVIVQVETEARAENLLRALEGHYRHRMFWVGTPEAQTFRTPIDFRVRTYSFSGL
jgi:hypothetical protein